MLLRSLSGISQRWFAIFHTIPELAGILSIPVAGADRRTEVPANWPSPRTSVNSLPSGGTSVIHTNPFKLMASEFSARLTAGGLISTLSVHEKASIPRVFPSQYPSATFGYSTMTSLLFEAPQASSRSTWLTSRVSVASRIISSGFFIT